MQITITQAEIETAIRNYTLALIAVREDMRIDIELRATRGAEGYTAVIDINPAGGPDGGEAIPETPKAEPEAKAEVATEPKTETLAVEVEAEAPKRKPKAVGSIFKKAAPAPVEQVEEASVEAPATEDNQPQSAPANEDDVPFEADSAPEVKAAEPVEKPRSIFSKLQKPVNTPKAEPEAA